MKLKYTPFRPLLWTSGGSVKILSKIFSVKGGCQNLETQGHLLSSGHHPSQSYEYVIAKAVGYADYLISIY